MPAAPPRGHGITPIVVADVDIDVPAHQVVLTMQPGNIESFVSCGGESAPNAYTYFPVWYYLHTDELLATGVFALKNWNWVGGAVVATKTYDRTAPAAGGGDGTFFETTTLTLRHTPQA